MDGGGELLAWPAADLLDHRGDLVLVQPTEPDVTRNWLPAGLRDRLVQRLPPRLGVPMGADDHQVGVVERACEESQEEQRRLVGRMEVVEDQHDRLSLARRPQERGGRVEETEPRPLGIE
jgi:hypothetical protein